LQKTLNALVEAQPDERHANRTVSVLEWYDRHRAYGATSDSNEEVLVQTKKFKIYTYFLSLQNRFNV